MRPSTVLKNGLIGAAALLCAGSYVASGRSTPAPAMAAPVASYVRAAVAKTDSTVPNGAAEGAVSAEVATAIDALKGSVRRLSHPAALEDAFTSYFAFKAAHPEQVKKPYL